MIPQRIDPAATPEELCLLAYKWRIDWMLAAKLSYMAALLPITFGISIISGWRSEADQAREAAKPDSLAAPYDLSTHTSCPVATGADLSITLAVTNGTKAEFGRCAILAGLRWGGGSPVKDGIPKDWNHVDLGRRT